MRFELMTSSLPRKRSTPENALPTELLPLFSFLFRDSIIRHRIVGQSFTQVNSLPPRLSSSLSRKINFKIFQIPRWHHQTSHRRSVIYASKLPSSSLVFFALGYCGRRWIRTTEGINQQIYSLPHLATLVFSRFFVFFVSFLR